MPHKDPEAARATSRKAKDLKRGFCYVPFFFPEHLPHSYHPLDTGIIPAHVEERFWGLVERGEPDQCWEWTGVLQQWDFRHYGEVVVSRRRITSFELSGLLRWGLTPGFTVRQCRLSGICCNPRHLTLEPGVFQRQRATLRNCPNGHRRTRENTYVSRLGTRTCLICHPSTRTPTTHGKELPLC